MFSSKLASALENARDGGSLYALCFIDLDNLKTINDTYGHATGDAALKSIGYALRGYERRYDGMVGRYGGDEFVMLMTDIDDEGELRAVLDEMVGDLHVDIQVGDAVVSVHCSIGAACGTGFPTPMRFWGRPTTLCIASSSMARKGISCSAKRMRSETPQCGDRDRFAGFALIVVALVGSLGAFVYREMGAMRQRDALNLLNYFQQAMVTKLYDEVSPVDDLAAAFEVDPDDEAWFPRVAGELLEREEVSYVAYVRGDTMAYAYPEEEFGDTVGDDLTSFSYVYTLAKWTDGFVVETFGRAVERRERLPVRQTGERGWFVLRRGGGGRQGVLRA